MQFQLAGRWTNAGPNLLGQVMLSTDGVFLDQMDYQELQTAPCLDSLVYMVKQKVTPVKDEFPEVENVLAHGHEH